MELCDLACPTSPNFPLNSSASLPQNIRITPNSIQDARDWRILYHLRSTTKTLDPDSIPPLKLKIKRRKTFRVLNVIPASTFASPTSHVQEATQQREATKQFTEEVVQLYSHRHGTVISCQGQMCQTLSWKKKWRVCGGAVDVRGYRWQSLRQEEDGGGTVSSPSVDEKPMARNGLDYRGRAGEKKKETRPGTWTPFMVKRGKGSEIWCWESRDTTSGRVDAGGAEQEEIAALMEEGRLEFVNEGLAEKEKQRILLTAVAITEWERWERRPGLAEKGRQQALRILCLTA